MEQQPSGGSADWMNTFADLMQLLLCFFVLLFSMSSVDAEKFEQVSVSFSSAFSIFDGGGSSIGEGQLISAGISQLNELGEYFSNMGEDSYDPEQDMDYKDDSHTPPTDLDEALDKIQEEMKEATESMHDRIADLSEGYGLDNYMDLTIDPEFRFVQLSMKGSILFDSGRAEIKEEAIPVLSKIGDILVEFLDFTIEIEGHTDNVPMSSQGTYINNNWLSSARALNAAEYLINNKQLDPAKLKYSGRGEYDPIASNDTYEGRAKNRRIEIKIYNKLSSR